MSDDEFRTRTREAVAEFATVSAVQHVWERFASSVFYQAGDPKQPELYTQLASRLSELEQRRGGPPNRLSHARRRERLHRHRAEHRRRRLARVGVDGPSS